MAGTGVSITQRIESKNCVDLAGATVTLSFWALNSTGTDNLTAYLYTATAGVDNWGSQTVASSVVSASPSGSWTFYTATFTSIPSTATNGVGIGIGRGSNATSTTLITGVQLEKGTQATSFDYRPYGTELQLCQRYYQMFTGATGQVAFMSSAYTGNSNHYSSVPLVVQMRTSPTCTTTAWSNASGASVNSASLTAIGINMNQTSSGYFSSGDTVTASAEL
jgi:hypothetical protein